MAGTERITVRTAQPRDLSRILALYEQLAEGRPKAAPADAEVAASVYERIRDQEGRRLLVALVGGTPCGAADVLVVPNLTHGGKPWMIVENVVVDSPARRRGVGDALMAEVVRLATEASCYKIQLLSAKGRDDAHSFYEKQGFEALAEGFRQYLE